MDNMYLFSFTTLSGKLDNYKKMNQNYVIMSIVLLIVLTFPLSGMNINASKENFWGSNDSFILNWADFSPYIQEFNQNDDEIYIQYFPNSQAELFLKENIPYFDCPDRELEKTYYFRWWTYRKHIKKTPEGFVITEFLPDVPWAGKYNTINCAAGHHFYEGRWLHNENYLSDYANFWFKGGGEPRRYSFWAANSILAFACVHQDKDLVINLLPYLDKNYEEWEKNNLCPDGLFKQIDDRDGMEVSIGGSGKRATINSYMIGDAEAIAEIAHLAGDEKKERKYKIKAEGLKSLMLGKLWDKEATFFKTLQRNRDVFVDVRELHGYTPWYFNIPEEEQAIAWKYLLTTNGFEAPYGPTSAEQNHPGFKIAYEGHECQWNGPSWPYATSVTLKAVANLLRNYHQTVVSKYDFMQLLLIYSNSQRRTLDDGKEVCWIDENLNPYTGDWISRTMLKTRNAQPKERGKDYNHSAFCDFIISDLVGIRPSMDDKLTINPLIPVRYWDWFCLDHVKYHNKILTIVWDHNGSKYHKEKGFSVYVDGELRHNSEVLKKIEIHL